VFSTESVFPFGILKQQVTESFPYNQENKPIPNLKSNAKPIIISQLSKKRTRTLSSINQPHDRESIIS
jgi:hypothetical protein